LHGGGEDFTSFKMVIPHDFEGRSLRLTGWLRTSELEKSANLWLRQDGPGGPLQFANSGGGLMGTTDWTEYTVSLPLDDRAREIAFGAVLQGEGVVWADDFQLEVDGVPVWQVAKVAQVVPLAQLDTEFDDGSSITARELAAEQVDRLELLGRVWGFVKYHHPKVRSGGVNWDYELFRVLPSVLDTSDPTTVNQTLASWLIDLGDPAPCDPCARVPADVHLTPDLDWIRDRERLGDPLSSALQRIYDRRHKDEISHYVGFGAGVGNPEFSNEGTYATLVPDAGFRLLALYRFWNIIEYWFPYRDLIDDVWGDVLMEFIPRVMREVTDGEYRLIMQELSVRVEDTHANVGQAFPLRPPRGPAELPVIVRFIEGQAVVTGFKDDTLGPTTGLRVGDVIERLDERPIDDLLRDSKRYFSASNEAARLREMASWLTRGPEGAVQVTGRRAEGEFQIRADRVLRSSLDPMVGRWHDLPGEAFQMLAPDVAYLKLSTVLGPDVRAYVERALEAEVFVVDIRNYPGTFVPFLLGGHFVEESTPFARFTTADPANPGAFRWHEPISLSPVEPFFSGQVVILVDEVSVSQAEYTAMALRAGPRAIVAGSTTAGADGNVSPIPLPGGIRSLISGIGVFYPDRTPTQQIGIIPDLEIMPTIEGIRAGRDEVLEKAVSAVLGREFRLQTPRW